MTAAYIFAINLKWTAQTTQIFSVPTASERTEVTTRPEYIDREKAEEAFANADTDVCESYPDKYSTWGFGRENARNIIRSVPVADVAPVVHGKWISDGNGYHWTYNCSICGWKDGYPFNERHNFCPNCGAKMDL